MESCKKLYLSKEKYPICTWDRCETIFDNSTYVNAEENLNDFEEFDKEFENEKKIEFTFHDDKDLKNDSDNNNYIITVIILNTFNIGCHMAMLSRYARAFIEQNMNMVAIEF
jgi:hypothetical protein